ncbi:hypothetical protein ACFLXC_00265 [Chloroflexota bacterium]
MSERKLAELAAKLRASFDASGLDEKLAEETATLLKEYAKELDERLKAILRNQ